MEQQEAFASAVLAAKRALTRTFGIALLVLSGCVHPVTKALNRGDLSAACRAFWADRHALLLPDEIKVGVGIQLRPTVKLAWRIEPISLGGLDNLSLYRVTLSVDDLPPGAVAVDFYFPRLRIQTDQHVYAPQPQPPLRATWEPMIPLPVQAALEKVPSEYLPQPFVAREAPGHYRKGEYHELKKATMFFMTGGLAGLLPDVSREYVPPSAEERRRWKLRQAEEHIAHDIAEATRVQQATEQISAANRRNETRRKDHERALLERSAALDALMRAFALPPNCERDETSEILGYVRVRKNARCVYTTYTSGGPKLIHDVQEMYALVRVVFADDCRWEQKATIAVPNELLRPGAEIFRQLFTDLIPMQLSDAP